MISCDQHPHHSVSCLPSLFKLPRHIRIFGGSYYYGHAIGNYRHGAGNRRSASYYGGPPLDRLATTSGLETIQGDEAISGLETISDLKTTRGLEAMSGLKTISALETTRGDGIISGLKTIRGDETTRSLKAISGLKTIRGGE